VFRDSPTRGSARRLDWGQEVPLPHIRSLPPVLLLLAGPLAAQATIHVPGDVPTIQGALDVAQSGDTIRVAPGDYNERIDFLGKALTLESEAGVLVTRIDGQGLFGPVVSFVHGEGPGSILRGFWVVNGASSDPGAGVCCVSGGQVASPRIERCTIGGNRAFGAGGGVSGAPTLVDCLIEGNVADGSFGGGVWGSPSMRRCVVRGNQASVGGGLALMGGRVEDSVVQENGAEEQGFGADGAGVWIDGGATLLRCVIANNHARGHGNVPILGAAVRVQSGRPLLASCTIVGNDVDDPSYQGVPNTGGVYGAALLIDTILRGNGGEEHGPPGSLTALYSNVEGGLAGTGNFDLDPAFRDAGLGDYRLLPGSPCIDTGIPAAAPDPDGSPADVGALAFAHAVSFVRNGSGTNPLLLASATPPVIGSSWHLELDASLVPGTFLSGITLRSAALDPGLPSPAGEILVGGSVVFGLWQPSNGTLDDLVLPLPNDLALLGLELHVQGFVRSPGGLRLANALRVLLGQ